MRIQNRFYLPCAAALTFCSLPAFALDGRGGACGASLLQVMLNPALIVISLAVAVCVGAVIAMWRKRRDARHRNRVAETSIDQSGLYEATSVGSQYHIAWKPAVIAGVCVYVLLLGPVWFLYNLCI